MPRPLSRLVRVACGGVGGGASGAERQRQDEQDPETFSFFFLMRDCGSGWQGYLSGGH